MAYTLFCFILFEVVSCFRLKLRKLVRLRWIVIIVQLLMLVITMTSLQVVTKQLLVVTKLVTIRHIVLVTANWHQIRLIELVNSLVKTILGHSRLMAILLCWMLISSVLYLILFLLGFTFRKIYFNFILL